MFLVGVVCVSVPFPIDLCTPFIRSAHDCPSRGLFFCSCAPVLDVSFIGNFPCYALPDGVILMPSFSPLSFRAVVKILVGMFVFSVPLLSSVSAYMTTFWLLVVSLVLFPFSWLCWSSATCVLSVFSVILSSPLFLAVCNSPSISPLAFVSPREGGTPC